MTTEEILSRLENVKQVGNREWRANCPSCGDTKGHLYISCDEKMTVMDCKKGCSWENVLASLNLAKKDIYVHQYKKERWELLRKHVYTSENGNSLAVKTIYRKPDGSKTAIWQRYEGDSLVKGLNGLKMPLYHVDKITDNTKPVFIVEGEKDVETLEYLGYIATTSPNGAGSHWKSKYNEYFKGYDVIVLADNDDVGIKYATEVADSLIGFAKTVKLVPTQAVYSDLKPKGDISDVMLETSPERTVGLLQSILNSNEFFHTQKTSPKKKKGKIRKLLSTKIANYSTLTTLATLSCL